MCQKALFYDVSRSKETLYIHIPPTVVALMQCLLTYRWAGLRKSLHGAGWAILVINLGL